MLGWLRVHSSRANVQTRVTAKQQWLQQLITSDPAANMSRPVFCQSGHGTRFVLVLAHSSGNISYFFTGQLCFQRIHL